MASVLPSCVRMEASHRREPGKDSMELQEGIIRMFSARMKQAGKQTCGGLVHGRSMQLDGETKTERLTGAMFEYPKQPFWYSKRVNRDMEYKLEHNDRDTLHAQDACYWRKLRRERSKDLARGPLYK